MDLEARYRDLAPLLSSIALEPLAAASWPGSERCLFARLTPAVLAEELEIYRILPALRQRHFAQIDLQTQHRGPSTSLRVGIHPRSDDALLIELVLWREWVRLTQGPLAGRRFAALSVEQLRLQDPRQTFHAPAQALPGQRHPGLGLGHAIQAMLVGWAARLGAEVLMVIPEYFHTAVIFRPYYHYADLEMRAIFAALQRQLLPQGLAPAAVTHLSWCFERGQVLRDGAPFFWPTEAQLHFVERGRHSSFVQQSLPEGAIGRFSLAPAAATGG